MRQKELRALQSDILSLVVANQESTAKSNWWTRDFTTHDFSKSSSAIIRYGEIVEHDEVYDLIARLKQFYDNVTPDMLKILNESTTLCPHCNEELTVDEFYQINSAPVHIGLLREQRRDEDSTISLLCKECTYKAPVILSSIKDRPGFVYLAYWDQESLYKIGMSRNPESRMKQLSFDYPGICLVSQIPASDMYIAETQLLARFLHRHVKNELFDLASTDVEFIKGLAQ